jgi:asparagine synthase (glutamine-hydrolysing)
MCGISAVIALESAVPGSLQRSIRVMHSTLAHRGPDGEGFLILDSSYSPHSFRDLDALPIQCWSDARVAIAFRRLKIRDLSEDAAQPMSSPDKRTWIVFNGEIYNFAEIRFELQRLGHVFLTHSDTEVILAGYRQWGQACFEKFNGMWAILIFDLAERAVIGSRDRLGIKPLYYSIEQDRLLFASEAKAIALAEETGPAIEPYRFKEFLLGFPPQSADLSFFKNVHPVPAGTTFGIDLTTRVATAPNFRRYWDLAAFHSDESPRDFDQTKSEFLELLRSSAEYQLGADVEVGCLLSGGLDTSMVSCLVAPSHDAPPLKTFSIVYDDLDMSELPYIQAVVAQGNLQNCTFKMTPEIAWASIDRVVGVQGQPLLGQDLIAQYHAYELARRCGAVVVLDGQGADEMLGGMPFYETPIFLELIAKFKYVSLMNEIRCRSRLYARSSLSIFRQYVLGAYRRKIREKLLPLTCDWLDCELANGPGKSDDYGSDSSALNRFLYHKVRHTNLPTVLIYQDRSSMAHAVESRVPFLDHRIVEFCFRLPPAYKIARGERKRILREVAREYLPDVVMERKDKKVFVSKSDWLPLGQHSTELRDMAFSRTMQELPWVRPKRMTRFVENFLRGLHHNSSAVWRLYTAWRWLETTQFRRSEMPC